jgi:hypothetical protein
MTKQLHAEQQAFLEDLEKGEKTVDLIFLEHQISTNTFGKWLRRRSFLRAIEDMRARMSFRLEQELVRGAEMAAIRLHLAVKGGWHPTSAQVQALVNTIKLCNLIVRSPKLKKDAAEAAQRLARRQAEEGYGPGYHHSHTTDQAAALLRRLEKRRRREEKLEPDQDEEGKWVSTD